MIILSVHNSSDIYGASRSLLIMLRPFARDGHGVHVVLPEKGPLADLLRKSGVTVHIFAFLAVVDRKGLGSPWGALAFCFRYLFSVLWLSGLIIALNADVVHTNTGVLPSPAMAAFLTDRKHFWHVREFFLEFPGIWKFYQRYIWLFSTIIIAVSNAVRDQFNPRLRQKCTTIYNCVSDDALAVDFEKVQEFRTQMGACNLLVGVVGRIKWTRKGQEVLVKAAAILRDRFPHTRYAIVGSVWPGNEEHLTRLRQLVRENNLEETVIFTGDIEEPRDIYAALDITVVPSVLPEPFGRVVLESMAVGTPVVGSRCGGIPEQIIDGSTGMLVAPGDEEELARALAILMTDDEMRVRMGQEGQKRVRDNFLDGIAYGTWSKLFEQKGFDAYATKDEAIGLGKERKPRELPSSIREGHVDRLDIQ